MGAFGSKFGLGDIPDLMGKVAVVTGVGRGYGLQIAKTLLSKGAIVIITDYSMDELMISVNDIKANNLGTKLKGFVLVPSSIESINKFIASLAKEYQAIDILISNAHTTAVELEKTTDGLEFTMGTNLIGSAYMITQMIPLLGGAKSGRIVVMCSGDIIDVSKGMYEDRLADIGGEKMVKIDNTDALFEESMLMLSMYVAQLADELAATNIKVLVIHISN
jgi:NAD(P)-dependent dehydrogenase (short-subunit alcohol dehydrogenase family)